MPSSVNCLTVREVGRSTADYVDYLPDEDEPVMVMKYVNYKVSMTIGVIPSHMVSLTTVLDTGAGPNLVSTLVLPEKWKRYLQVESNLPPIRDASNNRIRTVGTISLHVRIGELRCRVRFIVVTNLAVDCILGTSFIDQYVEAIRPRKRAIQFVDNSRTPIVGKTLSTRKTENNSPKSENQSVPTVSNKIRLCKAVRIPPMTQATVQVQSAKAGLCFLQNHPRVITKRLSLMANGVMDIVPKRPFTVIISNFSSNSVTLPRNMVIGLALPAPAGVFEISSILTKTPAESEKKATTEEDQKWKDEVPIGIDSAIIRERVISLLEPFQSMWTGTLGSIHATSHHINLEPGTKPIHQQPYRAGHKARQEERKQIDKMLEQGVIEPSSAEWASPVVLVPKKDGTLRFCVDYRKLNAATIRDSYPIPRMDECIDSLGEATVFTTLDCNSGYWQIPLAEEDKNKTTFTSHMGLFRYTRMPFGLKNAPATFQRAVDIILSRVKWQYALVYIDDVIIYSKTMEEHFYHVQKVLSLLRDAGVTLKLSKCNFFTGSVDYLGHTIRPGKLEVASTNLKALEEAKYPTNQTVVRSFLGMCNVYRRFVPNFSRIAAPLNKKLRKGEPTNFEVLNDEEYDAFSTLKKKLMSPPILALPRPGYPYTVDTDACNTQVGCCLLQEQPDGNLHPVGYWSRTLSEPERNYSTSEQECLAIVWSLLMLRPYLEGSAFTIRTDHDPLKWLLNITDPTGRLGRWRLRLSEFDFTVQYRPGRKHNLADGMSRILTEGGDRSKLDDDIPCLVVHKSTFGNDDEETFTGLWDDVDDILMCQDLDHDSLQKVLAMIPEETDIVPITPQEFLEEQSKDPYCQSQKEKTELDNSKFKYDHNGFLVRRSSIDGALQKVVPKSLQARLLYLAHYPRLAGHPGAIRMYYTLRREYYWPMMASDVYNTVKECSSCASVRGTLFKHQKYLKLFPAAGPLEFIAIDILGPLPKTRKGNQVVLVITDRFSKICRAIPLPNQKAVTLAEAFLNNWIYPYGAPLYLLTDNGSNLAAKFFEAVCYFLGVKHLFTTAYHPQTNGQVERYNKTLVGRLAHYVEEHQRDWDEFVQPCTYAYNMQVHRTTGTTPFDLVLTRHPPNIIVRDIPAAGSYSVTESNLSDAARKKVILRRIAQSLQEAKTKMSAAQRRYKEDFDNQVRHLVKVKDGDMVYVDRPPRHLDQDSDEDVKITKKLLPKTTGPYKVIRSTPDTVTISQDGLENTISIDRVTVAPSRSTPRAVTADPTGPNQLDDTPEESSGENGQDTTPTQDEYPIEKIVTHHATDEGIKYQVRWLGYTAAEDTLHFEKDLPYNMVTRYWKKHA